MTKENLQAIAKNLGLRGWAGMNKDELIVFINDYLFSPPIYTFDWMRKEDLHFLAKKHNLRGKKNSFFFVISGCGKKDRN